MARQGSMVAVSLGRDVDAGLVCMIMCVCAPRCLTDGPTGPPVMMWRRRVATMHDKALACCVKVEVAWSNERTAMAV